MRWKKSKGAGEDDGEREKLDGILSKQKDNKTNKSFCGVIPLGLLLIECASERGMESLNIWDCMSRDWHMNKHSRMKTEELFEHSSRDAPYHFTLSSSSLLSFFCVYLAWGSTIILTESLPNLTFVDPFRLYIKTFLLSPRSVCSRLYRGEISLKRNSNYMRGRQNILYWFNGETLQGSSRLSVRTLPSVDGAPKKWA